MNSNIEDIQELHGQKVLFVLGKGRNGKEEYVKISDTLYKLLKSVIKERNSGAIFLSTSNRANPLQKRRTSSYCHENPGRGKPSSPIKVPLIFVDPVGIQPTCYICSNLLSTCLV